MKIIQTVSLALFVFSLTALSSCNKESCDDISCLNGGVCKNGKCDCPDGYEGSACADQREPVRMFITSVEVTRFPALKEDGSSWDLSGGPDIMIEFWDELNQLFQSSTFYENADASQDYTFNQAPIQINDVTAEHTLYVMDNDAPGDPEFMGGIIFTPYYSETNEFPTSLILDAQGKVAFVITLSYEW